jgi:putative hemolysin
MRRNVLVGILAPALMLLAACNPSQAATDEKAGLPNPASVFCEENGGQLEMRTGSDGGVSGVCVFPDGSECEEWAYFRSECAPGEGIVPSQTETPSASAVPLATETPVDGWRVYHDSARGYSFSYPPGTTIELDDNPAHSITLIGPEENGERWPQITISHPGNLPEFLPPEGVDLELWLTEHSLMGDSRMPDVEVGGTTAIHLRHDRSPQSYAYDRYYFARGGQLYMIVIGHAGDREDWDLYNHFLDSFHFD